MNRESNSLFSYIIVAAITSYLDYTSNNYFKRVKGWHTAKLFYPLAERIAYNNRLSQRGIDPYQVIFRGNHPLTGLPVQVIFNESNQPNKRLLTWNHLMNSWMYSEDAGLTWKPVDDYTPSIHYADLVLQWPPIEDEE